MNSLQLWFTHLSEETLSALGFMIVLVTAALVGFWIYNRRKYQQLAHQIPASVVKNYLDSIIQNSSALKSSLFRGGGLETSEGLSVPSVKPVHDLPTGGGSISSEEYVQKNAELASLRTQVSDKNQMISELEAKLADATSTTVSVVETADSSAQINELNTEIASLKEKLANAESFGTESENLIHERDELKNRLAEYEIIEDDLANLKKLQQENKQLKAALGDDKSSEDSDSDTDEEQKAAPLEIAEQEVETNSEQTEAESVDEPAIEAEEQIADANTESSEEEAQVHDISELSSEEEISDEEIAEAEGKSAEDLLSEFEKMLG